MSSSARVRALRVALGHSQSALAALTGVLDQSYINKIESGRNKASTHHVRAALARAFCLSLEDLALYLDGKVALKQALTLARRSSGQVTNSVSTTSPSSHDDMIVAVPNESGSSDHVPLLELIRVYQIATKQRGVGEVDLVAQRLETAEARALDQSKRLDAMERMLAEVEQRMAQAGLSSVASHTAAGEAPGENRSRSRKSGRNS